MKKYAAAVFLALLVVLCGCADKKEQQKEQNETAYTDVITPTEPEILQNETEEAETSDVSALATENFLEPFDDYSWTREYPIEKVVVHFTSAVVNYRDDPYSMELIRNIFVESGLSIHYIIDRDGKIFCYMPESRAAWHAGAGEYGGDEKYTNSMNKYSVGIELVAIGSENDMAQYMYPEEYALLDDSLIGFTDEQYESLISLVKDICERNDIEFSRENVIGHDEYNKSKSDPGELFEWDRVFAEK